MAYFPMFIDLKDREILVVGGGSVATRKVQKLLPFSPSIVVVAPKVSRDLNQLGKEGTIKIYQRNFELQDLEGKFMVVAALDDRQIQQEICLLAEKKGLACNCADWLGGRHFIFPALVVRGDLTVGISTAGKSPALSAKVRQKLEGFLSEDLAELLERLHQIRKTTAQGEELEKTIRQLLENF